MLNIFVFFVLFQFASSQLSFYSVPNQCDHDLCEPNGVCQVTNGTYQCKCNSNHHGKHCEIQDCVSGDCAMTADYCNAHPKIKCLNDGQCVNTARGFRCRCPSKFEGKYCESEKKPIYLNGEVVMVLSGNREEIIQNLDQILTEIDQVNNITVHVQIESNTQHPVAYSIGGTNNVVSRAKRDVDQKEEVLLLTRIEITRCLEQKRTNPQRHCPDSVTSVIEQLQEKSQLVEKALAPLGIKIVRIFSRIPQQKQQIVIQKQLVIVFVLAFTTVFLLLLIAFLLTRKNDSNLKHKLISAQMSVDRSNGSQTSSLSSIVTVESSTSNNNPLSLLQVSPVYKKECVV